MVHRTRAKFIVLSARKKTFIVLSSYFAKRIPEECANDIPTHKHDEHRTRIIGKQHAERCRHNRCRHASGTQNLSHIVLF